MIFSRARTARQRFPVSPWRDDGLDSFLRRASIMTSRQETETLPGRKSYQKPSLETYGSLKDLTTGGSGSANEGSSGKNPRP